METPILLWPDTCLSQTCERVEPRDNIGALIPEMFDAMYAASGRGLAAPQIGVLKNVFVMDAGWKDGAPTPLICINPEILSASEEMETGPESCLSIPDVAIDVTRPARILMRWRDLNDAIHARSLEGAEAKIAQHEIDHLKGRVIFDHLSPEQRQVFEDHYFGGMRRARA